MVTPFHRIVSSGERPDDEECLERSCHAAMHEYAIQAVSQCSRHDEVDGPGTCILHFGRVIQAIPCIAFTLRMPSHMTASISALQGPSPGR